MINNLGPRYADHASSKFNLLQKKYSRRYTATNKVFKLSTTFEISARVFIATFQANSKSCQDCKAVQRAVYHLPLYNKHLKALVVLYAFEESVDCHLLSFKWNKDWGCVILREINFLLNICWSIPCLHPS